MYSSSGELHALTQFAGLHWKTSRPLQERTEYSIAPVEKLDLSGSALWLQAGFSG